MSKQFAVPEVIIIVKGGSVQNVIANTKGLKLSIIDYDLDTPYKMELLDYEALPAFDFRIYKQKLQKELNVANNSEH